MIGNTNANTFIKNIDGYDVESIDNLDGTQTLSIIGGDELITKTNINQYKFEDISLMILNGGLLGTDQEYENAEEYLQTVYKKVMEGENE